jgi:hypothetical protein
MTSGIEAKGRFGNQDFVYLSDEDVYRCPAGEKLRYYYTNEENGQKLRRYWTNAMRQRRETVEHPFGTLKMRMGATRTASIFSI